MKDLQNDTKIYRKRLNSIEGTKVELSISTHALFPIFAMQIFILLERMRN